MMKLKTTLLALIVASSFAGAVFAADAAPAKEAGCCVKAEKAGKACDHECCVAAAKDGKNCAKCGGSGEVAKK